MLLKVVLCIETIIYVCIGFPFELKGDLQIRFQVGFNDYIMVYGSVNGNGEWKRLCKCQNKDPIIEGYGFPSQKNKLCTGDSLPALPTSKLKFIAFNTRIDPDSPDLKERWTGFHVQGFHHHPTVKDPLVVTYSSWDNPHFQFIGSDKENPILDTIQNIGNIFQHWQFPTGIPGTPQWLWIKEPIAVGLNIYL